MATNNLNTKVQLATTNDPCWILTYRPFMLTCKDKFCIKIKGKWISSLGHWTKLASETDLFDFRLSKELGSARPIIIEKANDLAHEK